MKKFLITGTVVVIVLGLLAWFFLSMPSSQEDNGDRLFKQGEYQEAAVFYRQAIAAKSNFVTEDRLYFKIGKAYKYLGEHDQAMPFFIKLKAKGSSYSTEIEKILKDEIAPLQEDGLAAYQFDSAFVDEVVQVKPEGLSLAQIKEKRDKIYTMLIMELTQRRTTEISYGLKDLYKAYKKMETSFKQKVIKQRAERWKVLKNEKKFPIFCMDFYK